MQNAPFARKNVCNLFRASKVDKEWNTLQHTVSACLVHLEH